MTTTINASTTAGLVQTADTSGVLALQTAGTTAVTVDASQNVGIGTASPSYKVEMAITSGSNFYSATTSATGQDIGYRLASTATGGREYRITTSDPTRGGNTNSLAFVDQTAGAARMLIDSSGNVGIGTSPTSKLDVTNGSAAANCIIKITNSGTWGAYMQGVTSNRTFSYGAFDLTNGFASGSWGVRDETAAAWRMMIDNSGNLLVGTTSGAGERLSVVASSGNATMSVQVSANGNSGVNFKNVSSTTVGQIVVNSSTTAYNTSSDYRLKQDITPMTGALTKVALLKPCAYKWKVDGSDGEGFIAHELAEVCPHAVTGEKDAVDENENPVYQGIDTSFLVATLTAAIQEQQALITQLQADVASLKGA